MSINLDLFCNPEERAPGRDLSVPFSLNGHTYASNGAIVCASLDAPTSRKTRRPRTLKSSSGCPGISRASSSARCPSPSFYPTNAGGVLVGAMSTDARIVVVNANSAMEAASSRHASGSARLFSRSVHRMDAGAPRAGDWKAHAPASTSVAVSLQGRRGPAYADDALGARHGSPPRRTLQRAVVEHLRWRARPGVWWCHLANGGWRSPIEAKIFKALGVVAGAPDLLIVAAGRAYFLELKAPRGRVSSAQRECHEALRAAGATVAVASNIDEALDLLKSWQILRPNLSAQTAKAFQRLRDERAAPSCGDRS